MGGVTGIPTSTAFVAEIEHEFLDDEDDDEGECESSWSGSSSRSCCVGLEQPVSAPFGAGWTERRERLGGVRHHSGVFEDLFKDIIFIDSVDAM